jgi:hypothetical protein
MAPYVSVNNSAFCIRRAPPERITHVTPPTKDGQPHHSLHCDSGSQKTWCGLRCVGSCVFAVTRDAFFVACLYACVPARARVRQAAASPSAAGSRPSAYEGVGGHGGMLSDGVVLWKPVLAGRAGQCELRFYTSLATAGDAPWLAFLPRCVPCRFPC